MKDQELTVNMVRMTLQEGVSERIVKQLMGFASAPGFGRSRRCGKKSADGN